VINPSYSLHKLSFSFLTRLVVSHYKRMLLLFLFITLIPLLFVPSIYMANFIFRFYIIFFVGLLLSYILHEYLHIQCMKRNRSKGEIKIELSLTKISLFPQFELSKWEMIKVALLPALLLPIVGLILIFIGNWTEQAFLTITGYIYIFHIISIVPPLGDGMMIIKALFSNSSN